MIKTKKDLSFYIAADRIMNGRSAKRNIKEVAFDYISGDEGGAILRYLRAMRNYSYYANTTQKGQCIKALARLYWGGCFRKLGIRLGFSIGYNSLGYGVVLPHYGTIVVNGEASIGNFAVLHTSTCIAGKKEIGDFLYLSAGSQIVGDIKLGDGVIVAAHSLVNHSSDSYVLLAGSPAVVKRDDYPVWTGKDGNMFQRRVEEVNLLKLSIYN